MFSTFQILQSTVQVGETKAAEMAGMMIRKSDKAV